MLTGKNVVITAGTGGIGKGIAKSCLQQGASVYFSGRSTTTVSQTVRDLNEIGLSRAHGIVADVGTLEGCEIFFNEIGKMLAASGEVVDVLINNLGIFESGNFFEITDENWIRFFNTNVMSTVRCCRHFLKGMLERNSGRVIIVSSECGLRPIGDMIPYSMTKAAQINIARGLAELTKGTNVTVNSLLPGPTSTEGVSSFIEGLVLQGFGKNSDEAIEKYFQTREPTSLLQRFLTVEEVANVAVFLASDLSGGINGASQRVEGGIIRHI